MSSFLSTLADRDIRARLPGKPGLPVVGTTFEQLRAPVEFAMALHRDCGPVAWTRSFGITTVILSDPNAIQQVFRNADGAFVNGPPWAFYIGKFFPRGLMLLDSDEHKFHRGVMQAAFKRTALEGYFAGMNDAVKQGVDDFRAGERFLAAAAIKQLTLDVATQVFMGEKLGDEADRVNRGFVDCVRAGTSLIRFAMPGGRWKKGLDGRKLLDDFFQSRIAAKRARVETDLFSRLCHAKDEAGGEFTNDDIVNHMCFLMMAAHDTSTITLCAMFYYLAKHPEWQTRLRDEALALGKTDLALEDLPRLPAMDLVVKECLRLLTPLPSTARMTVKEVEILGARIPANTFLALSMAATHRLPEWWTNPEAFDPERFAEGRAEHRKHPFAFVPFGGGAHKCIGMHFGEMEIKAVAFHTLLRFRVSVPPDYEMPIDRTSLPMPKDGLPIHLERIAPS